MDQNPSRLCPRCGTPAQPNQRFCSECGTTLNIASNLPTAMASGEQAALASQGSGVQFATQPAPVTNGSGDTATAPTQLVDAPGQAAGDHSAASASPSGAHFYSQTTDANPIPPPPPADSLVAPFNQAFTSYQPFDRTPSGSPAQVSGAYSVPDYARAPRRSRLGMVVTLVLLLLLVLGGVAAYALFFHKSGNNTPGNQGTSPAQNTPAANGNTPTSNITATTGSGGTTPTATTSTTGNGTTSEQLNLAFTYASINITITNVQYATSFPDDNSTPGGVRVAFTENNPTSNNPDFLYGDAARLILPDHSSIPPSGELQAISADQQTTRPNWLDFPVTTQPANLAQLVLQMGTAQENQMQIPLAPGADLSKYQPKTVTPGTPFHYAGLNWTLKSATESLSAADKQASTGNVYVTVTLSAFNPQANDYSAYYGDYVRLTVGGTTTSPTTDISYPLSFPSQATASGSLIFLVPQGSTAYTLDMLGNTTSSPPVQEVTVPFTIQ